MGMREEGGKEGRREHFNPSFFIKQKQNKNKKQKKKTQMESGSLCHNDEQYTKHMYSNYYKTCICSASQNIGTLLILAS